MYPVNPNVALPESFNVAPKAKKNLSVDAKKLDNALNEVIFMLNHAE